MSIFSGAQLGRGTVDLTIDNRRFDADARSIEARADRMGTKFRQLGGIVTAVFTGAAAAAITSFIRQASNAEETLNRFRQVFGDQARAAEEWADRTSRAVGRSRFAILDSLSTYQSFFIGLGFGGEEAAKMSKRLSQLAIDFASFNNISDAEANERFISALAGSSEVLDRFGVNIRAAALDQELLRMGMNKTSQQATEMEKAIARLGIIERVMGDQGSIGDAARTADQFANRLKALQAAWEEMSISIGEKLIGPAGQAINLLQEIVEQVEKTIAAYEQLSGVKITGPEGGGGHDASPDVGTFDFIQDRIAGATSVAMNDPLSAAGTFIPGVAIGRAIVEGAMQEFSEADERIAEGGRVDAESLKAIGGIFTGLFGRIYENAQDFTSRSIAEGERLFQSQTRESLRQSGAIGSADDRARIQSFDAPEGMMGPPTSLMMPDGMSIAEIVAAFNRFAETLRRFGPGRFGITGGSNEIQKGGGGSDQGQGDDEDDDEKPIIVRVFRSTLAGAFDALQDQILQLETEKQFKKDDDEKNAAKNIEKIRDHVSDMHQIMREGLGATLA